MSQHELQYLQEMGIQSYQLAHPERLLGYQAEKFALQASCKLLLVSPFFPENETALLFERVLKSIQLTLSDALHIFPEQIEQLGEHHLQWVWYAGCDASDQIQANKLVSPELVKIDGDNQQRRALWQQICAYQ
ncbi:DNA polymerase III subunit psi [Vibrio sp. NTOU-M3]|uniref:DNA polymerase III subunit psi n=1 Tax=Vibrio sp. NTOU-M3 TaxID=3234954 RepID=UPI00349F8EA4